MSLEGSILWYRDAIFVTSAHRELPRNQNIFIWWPAASCARGIRIVGLASALSGTDCGRSGAGNHTIGGAERLRHLLVVDKRYHRFISFSQLAATLIIVKINKVVH